MTKTELHQLVDAPEESLEAAAVQLRRAQDPVAAELDAAPYDDEEFTSENDDAVAEALGETSVPWSEVGPELRADRTARLADRNPTGGDEVASSARPPH